jgi:hypothetical protein
MGMNSQIHLTLQTDDLNSLRREAEKAEISVSELIRRKISLPPVDEELIILRKLKKSLVKNDSKK